MSRFDALANAIESHGFAAWVNVAQGREQFKNALSKERAVQEFISLLENRDNAEFCLARVWEISQYSVDVRFEHPFDTALAVYLYALNIAHPDLARIAAGAVERCSNCWWARQFGHEILSQPPVDRVTALGQTNWASLRTPNAEVAGRKLFPALLAFSQTEEQFIIAPISLQSGRLNILQLRPVEHRYLAEAFSTHFGPETTGLDYAQLATLAPRENCFVVGNTKPGLLR